MTVRIRPGTRKLAAAAATALLATVALSAATAPPASADGVVKPGNQTCGDLVAGAKELKVEPPVSGEFTSEGFTVRVTVYPLPADDPGHPGNQTGNDVFDFTSTGGVVLGVAVKGGPDTNFYAYPAGVTSGQRLHAPVNPSNSKFYGLSHISFCWVPKAKPKISTKVAAAEITIGGSVTDVATLTDGSSPTGTITFRVYGPGDATCAGSAVFTSTVSVNGNGSYTSAAFTPTRVGTYRWIASYSGDARNEPATGACDDRDEQVVVKKAKPRLATAPDLLPNDTATVTGAVLPSGGTVVFKLFTNLTCTGAPVYTEPAQAVNANGTFRTTNTTYRVSADASIAWLVEYSGDDNNEPAVSACTDEQVVMDFTPLT